ncbi:MAG TPA: (d)CMP kinase [Erysipelotrichaceae bacterium]|nr:(d)CMP kinase [Erysipelotrichaceae bacterium]
MKINIAIDGPSAAGKSTIAKKLAEKLGYVHLDTGAMYRCTALKAVRSGIALDDEASVCAMLEDTDIRLLSTGEVFMDGEDVSQAIRTDENSLAASAVSKLPKVREELVRRQQKMAEEKGYIMDGRDIGTVVLKDAEVKIFMTASPEARAERRYKQNIEKGIPTSDIATIAEEIRQRDYEDTHRAASPLKKADDATEIDTSYMTIEEVCSAIYALAEPFLNREA